MHRFSSLLYLMIMMLVINTTTIHAETTDAPFDDIKGHWAEQYIKDLYSKKIIFGNEKNKFEPDKEITIMEFLSMRKQLRIYWDLPEPDPFYQDFPSDWEEKGYLDKNNWYYDLLPMLNMVQNFCSLKNPTPTDIITREDAWDLLLYHDVPFINYANIKISDNMCYVFWDWNDYYPNNGYISEVSPEYLVVLGVIVPKKDFPHHTMPSLNPMKRITKGESAELISLFIEKMKQEKEIDLYNNNFKLDPRPLDMHISISVPVIDSVLQTFYFSISVTSNTYFYLDYKYVDGGMAGITRGTRSAKDPLKGDGYLLIPDRYTSTSRFYIPISANMETLHIEAHDRSYNVIKEWDIPFSDLISNGYSD